MHFDEFALRKYLIQMIIHCPIKVFKFIWLSFKLSRCNTDH